MTKISVVIIAFNEEKNLEACLKAAQVVADEMIVVDSFSKDRTAEVAQENGAIVHQLEWKGYSAQKNWANDQAQHEYILSLDADEVISPELAECILAEKKAGLKGSYSLNRLTNYCGTWIKHSGWYPDIKVRLFPKEGSQWEGEFVHETLHTPAGNDVQLLQGDLLHYSYNSLEDHVQRSEKYAKLAAEKLHAKNKQAGVLKPWLSGFAKFISMYLIKMGFLDGPMGFRIARISAQGNVMRYRLLRELNRSKS